MHGPLLLQVRAHISRRRRGRRESSKQPSRASLATTTETTTRARIQRPAPARNRGFPDFHDSRNSLWHFRNNAFSSIYSRCRCCCAGCGLYEFSFSPARARLGVGLYWFFPPEESARATRRAWEVGDSMAAECLGKNRISADSCRGYGVFVLSVYNWDFRALLCFDCAG